MPAAKRTQSQALSQMASATKRYPRFFHPHEVKSIDDSGGWEPVDGTDPDVFLVPSGMMGPESASGEISQRVEQITEESGVFDLGTASMPPQASGERLPSIRPTVPFRQPSRPEYADEGILSVAPTAGTQLGIGPSTYQAVYDFHAAAQQQPAPVKPADPTRSASRRMMMASPITAAVMEPLPPSSQPLSGYLYAPNSTAGAVMSIGQPPPSLLATMMPREERSYGMYIAALGAFAIAASGIFGGSHLAKGYGHQSLASLKAPTSEMAPAALSETPQMDLGAALANIGQAPAAAPKAEPVVAKPAASAVVKRESAPARAKAALGAGDLSTASLLFAEMTDSASTRLEGAVGLAEVSHARDDHRTAAMRYREIVVNYPAYLPARLGLADATWDSGDQAGGSKLYAGLQRQYAAKLLPPRVAERSKP